MAEHPALVAQLEPRPVGELAGLADVVEERRGHQQVGVEPRVELAEVADQRPHGDGVLEQAAEVGVVAGAGARGAAEVGGDRAAQQEALDRPQQGRIVDLAREVLEEALELLDRSVGGGQELRRVVRPGLQALDVVQLGDHLAAEALDSPAYADRVAALEPKPDAVGLAEHPGRAASRSGRGAPPTGRSPRFATSGGPSAGSRSGPRIGSRAQVGDPRRTLVFGRRSDCGFHASMVTAAPDGPTRAQAPG